MNGEKVLESKLSTKEVPSVCLSVYLLGRLLQHKDKHLIIDCSTGCLWTGKEIYDACVSVADAFINGFDLNPGDTVCFWCPNSDVHAIAFLGTISSGATYVAIDSNYSYNDVFRVAKLSSAKFLVCLSDYLPEALKLLESLESLERLFIIGGNSEQTLNDSKNCHFLMHYLRYKYKPVADSMTKPVPIPVPVGEHDMSVIHFIKQTKEGIPSQLMPVIRTNANLIHSCTQLHHLEILQTTPEDLAGNKIAFINSPLNKQKSLQFIPKYNITTASIDLKELFYLLRNDVEIRSTNQNLSKLYHDFSSLTDILHTGSPLPHSDALTEEVFRKLRPNYFRAIYGKPETGIISCVWKSFSTFDMNKHFTNYYSVGHPVPGVQIKIIHPKTEKSRSQNRIGEICVKSKQIIESNRNLSILTRNAFTIDGFFKTGDAGYYDSEGLLYLECRVDECIYEGKDVINPSSLETILLKHSAVKETAVIGIPDQTFGEICCAFVVLERNQILTEQTLLEFMTSRGKQLRAGIRFIDSMPRTLRSEVNRMALRVIYDNFHTYSLIEML